MSDNEEVMFAFRRFGVTRHLIVCGSVHKCRLAPCEYFVCITLVRNIVDNLVCRRIEHIVQGNGSLYHTQIRAYMTAVLTQLLQQYAAHFFTQCFQFACRKPLHVGRPVNLFYIHSFIINRWFI